MPAVWPCMLWLGKMSETSVKIIKAEVGCPLLLILEGCGRLLHTLTPIYHAGPSCVMVSHPTSDFYTCSYIKGKVHKPYKAWIDILTVRITDGSGTCHVCRPCSDFT